MSGKTIVGAAILGGLVADYYMNHLRHQERVNSANRVVAITGCDTGFGRRLAVRLSAMGFEVVVSCLTDQGLKALQDEDLKIVGAICDVTDARQVEAWFDLVGRVCGTRPLWAIVNNAGVGEGGRIDMIPFRGMEHTVKVNLIGTMLVTHHAVPHLRRGNGGGRIINIASIAGRMAFPGMSAYNASKFGVEGFSDAIRVEMKQFGIDVCIFEPGFFQTEIIADLVGKHNRNWQAMSDDVKKIYGETFRKMHETRVKNLKGKDPEIVVDELINAVTSKQPKRRYTIGSDARMLVWMSYLPAAFMDNFLVRSQPDPAMGKEFRRNARLSKL